MPDISADILAEGRVIPENVVTLSVFSLVRCFGFILHSEVVPTFVKTFLVMEEQPGQMMLCHRTGMKDIC